ncbi:MAG: hypothetical protein C0616_04755 [Desulfuromonas sp.]|nr:MAG: hypothetical protein C0616_04755 [Desulfuromonas sp.]
MKSRYCFTFILLAIFVIGWQPQAAYAIPGGGTFELETGLGNANATDEGADDWQTHCESASPGGPCANNGPDPGATADADAFLFTGIKDDPSPESIFTGGRKDIQLIEDWGHKDGSVPDKSDITNAYATAYNDNGDLIVYFGADRYANVGDTFMGFWFFRDAVQAEPDGSFSGVHMDGDTLVLVNFPQANNAVPEIAVVVWDPSCSKAANNNPQPGQCAAKNLFLIASADLNTGAICGSGGPLQDDVCANTNDTTITSWWPYMSKDGFVNQFPYESFFEGGINLTNLVGNGCFSSFMAETRSSSSFTAALKDFVIDSFETCSIDVTKNCANPQLNNANDMIIYDITGSVINNGFGTVYDIVVTDNPAFDSGSLDYVQCNDLLTPQSPDSLAGGASICYTATTTVTLANNGTSDTVTATANSVDNDPSTQLSDTAGDTCPNLQVSPDLSVDKSCYTDLDIVGGKVVVQVNVSGEICNTGDSLITNAGVEDSEAGVLLSGQTLNAPADPLNPTIAEGACAAYSGTYYPDASLDIDGDPTTVPGEAVFKDTVTAGGTDIFGSAVGPEYDNAQCPLCVDTP